jgi:hypothetical protein
MHPRESSILSGHQFNFHKPWGVEVPLGLPGSNPGISNMGMGGKTSTGADGAPSVRFDSGTLHQFTLKYGTVAQA